MNTFTASNGVEIRPEEGYGAVVSNLTLINEEMEALREFFQAEADERAGRWRWVEHPDYVVYDTGGAEAGVGHGRNLPTRAA